MPHFTVTAITHNRAPKFLFAIGFFLTATLAQVAGLRSINISADANGPAIHGMVWYPCAETPGEIHVEAVEEGWDETELTPTKLIIKTKTVELRPSVA